MPKASRARKALREVESGEGVYKNAQKCTISRNKISKLPEEKHSPLPRPHSLWGGGCASHQAILKFYSWKWYILVHFYTF